MTKKAKVPTDEIRSTSRHVLEILDKYDRLDALTILSYVVASIAVNLRASGVARDSFFAVLRKTVDKAAPDMHHAASEARN